MSSKLHSKLLFVATMVSSVLYVNTLMAHEPGYYGGSGGGLSGSVTIWGGSPYGPGYSGTINYGSVYAPAPPYHGAYWYPACAHWHHKAYRPPRNHGYVNGYVHGYVNDGHHGKKRHKGPGKNHHSGRNRSHHH
jgi:hypothetical protein